MVDSCSRFRTHKCRGQRIATQFGSAHDPLDVLGGDVLVGAEVNQFFVRMAIDDTAAHVFFWSDQVEKRIHERFDTAIDTSVVLNKDRCLRAAFWDVLVLELLRKGKAIDLVVETLAFSGVLRFGPGHHEAQAATSDVLESHMESIKPSAVHKEDPVGDFRAFVVGEECRIEA